MKEGDYIMAKKNTLIYIPEGMLHEEEQIRPLNPLTNEGYVIDPEYYVTDEGRYFSIKSGKFVEKQLQADANGYLNLSVMTSQGQKHLSAHRGVLSTFDPRPDMYNLQVDHRNGIHYDNRLSELQWATPSENSQYAADTKINPGRTRNITDVNIGKIMYLAKDGRTDVEISKMIKDQYIAPETIRMIRTGQEGYDRDLERLGYEPILKKKHTFLTEVDYARIRLAFESGKTPKEIAEDMGLSYSAVRHTIHKYYGDKDQRKDLNHLKKNPIIQFEAKKKDPISVLPDKYNDLKLYPVNVNTPSVKTLQPCYFITEDGRVFSSSRGNTMYELKPSLNKNGYLGVGLVNTEGTITHCPIHRLVMSTFDPRPDMHELEVDHIHGNKLDNRVSELKWVTHSENMVNAAQKGLTAHKKIYRTVSDDEVRIINVMAWSGATDDEIADHFNGKFTISLISDVRSGMSPYDKVLDELDLVPFKRRARSYTQEERDSIYEYIEDRKNSIGYMKAYEEASYEFTMSKEAIRGLYGAERRKRTT